MESLIDKLPKKFMHKDKYGLISLSAVIKDCPTEVLKSFAIDLGMDAGDVESKSRETLIRELIFLPTDPLKMPGILNPLEHMGNLLLNYGPLRHYLNRFDFLSKRELIDAFAESCADLPINVFEASEDIYGLDLYLTKKLTRLRTESVFVLIGSEIEEQYNEELLNRIEKSEEICDWRVFVTTPVGAIKIGYERLIEDMKERKVWTYIIDPFQKRVIGATKGSKSKHQDKQVRDAYIRQLPSEPIRAISQVVKRSKYKWDEKDAYDPDIVAPYYFVSMDEKIQFEPYEPIYRDKFRTLLLISKKSGLLMYSFSLKEDDVDKTLVSGFLTAIESFVKQLASESGLNEIDYKNLKVLGSSGEYVQAVAMMNQSPGIAFTQRLEYLVKTFESDYAEQIQRFVKMGNTNIITDLGLESIIPEILGI